MALRNTTSEHFESLQYIAIGGVGTRLRIRIQCFWRHVWPQYYRFFRHSLSFKINIKLQLTLNLTQFISTETQILVFCNSKFLKKSTKLAKTLYRHYIVLNCSMKNTCFIIDHFRYFYNIL